MEIISAVISGATLIIVTLIEARATKERRAAAVDKARTERRARERQEESLLSMELNFANLELSRATAIAVEKQKINGEMTKARAEAEEAAENYREFIRGLAARQVTKP